LSQGCREKGGVLNPIEIAQTLNRVARRTMPMPLNRSTVLGMSSPPLGRTEMESAKDTSGGALENLAEENSRCEQFQNPDITIYENEIPPFVERELEVLYESIYCTLARWRIYDRPLDVSTYVARRGEAIRAVFLFRHDNDDIQVLNQQVAISAEDIGEFAAAVFSRYQAARVISFYAIDTRLDRLAFPFQKYPALEENVVFLPASSEEYVASMSANFRSIVQRSERKILKQYPTFRFEVFEKDAVDEGLVREIIRMARARMVVKRKKAYVGEEHLESLMRLIRTHGYVGVATIDGKLCGGSVWYWVGRRNFLHLIAHDPKFDQYKLGNQTLLMAIRYWIGRGGRECWLMGGGEAHKSKFRAVSRCFESVVIYRSRDAFLHHWRRAAAIAVQRLMHRVHVGIRERAGGEGLEARFLLRCLALGRSLKRLGLVRA
jgi:hypothetical protein